MPGLDPELAAIWASMRPVALERVDRILAACDGTVDAGRAADDAHKLAGALGMYGLDEAGRLAVEVDRLLAEGALTDGRAGELRAVASALRQALAGPLRPDRQA